MTIDTVQASTCPNVFDAGLPTIAYDHLHSPDEAHRIIAQARLQAPIAIGPHGPEVLSYELVRTVLRDPRFCVPKGLVPRRTRHHLGPAVGQGHHRPDQPRRRRTPPAAPTRLQGIHTTGDRTAAHARSSRSSPSWSTQ